MVYDFYRSQSIILSIYLSLFSLFAALMEMLFYQLVEQLVQKSLAVMIHPTLPSMTSKLLENLSNNVMCSPSLVNKNNYLRRESCLSNCSIKSGHFSALPSNPSSSMNDSSELANYGRGNHFVQLPHYFTFHLFPFS